MLLKKVLIAGVFLVLSLNVHLAKCHVNISNQLPSDTTDYFFIVDGTITTVSEDYREMVFKLDRLQELLLIDVNTFYGQKIVIQILDEFGSEFYYDSFNAVDDPLQFNTTGLPRGIYLVRLLYQNKLVSQSFVLK